jgi:predicted ATPase/DNA-binding CsgD family transcriptional regulator
MLASGYASEARLTTKHHLPAYLTPLLGREQEVVEACTLLRRPEVRLVILTGPGGIGKTRLAVQLATELLPDFAGGVYFVSLAPINDSALVIPAIAQTLEVKESGTRPLMDLIKAFLKDKHVLLVLDNFEHLLPAAPQLADLLTSCLHLKLLVTSRAALHVQGEHELLVSLLMVPDLTHLPEQEFLSQYAAVALFLQRAQAVKPEFQLTSSNARSIAAICARLDGLPLAIELAAARIKMLPPQALLARLGQRFVVLTSGARDAPVRQQTLRNTIEWSYQLLDAEEQRLFQRLSVFADGCTLEAVEAIYTELDGDPGQVLDGVAALIDKSLFQQTELEGEDPRFVMLETIREYGLECLATSGEMEAVRQAHAMCYLSLAEKFEPAFGGPQQVMATMLLEQERENLRAALYWLIEHEEREKALRLSGTLWRFWRVHGPVREGLDCLERALSGSDGVQTSVRAKALYASGELALLLGDDDRAAAWGEESLLLYRALGDKRGIAASLMMLGQAASLRGNFVAALTLHQESLALHRELEDREGIADSLLHLGWTSFTLGDFSKAGEQYEGSLQILRDLGNREAIATVLDSLGHVANLRGEYARAHALTQEGLELFRELGDRVGIVSSLYDLARVAFLQDDLAQVPPLLEESLALAREEGHNLLIAFLLSLLGELLLCQGDATRARSSLEESMVLFKEAGSWRGVARRGRAGSLSLLAKLDVQQGDYVSARALYEESLVLAREMGSKLNIVDCLEGLAVVVATQGEPAWAAQLWGAAKTFREAMSTPIPPVYRTEYERSVTAARTQLGEKAFAKAWAEGRTMTPEQAFTAYTTQEPAVIPSISTMLGQASASPAPSMVTNPDGLTSREVEVLRLVAQGLTNDQVAEQLVIGPLTVNTHLTSIYGKIQVSSRAAATRYAIEHQFV